MEFSEITFNKLKNQMESFLKEQHSKASILFSNASPYGQILSVTQNLYQMSLLFLKNSIKQFDLSSNNSLNELIVKNAALSAGHIPGRAISSTGTLKLTFKTSGDIERDIPGGRISVFNRGGLKNRTNGLEYSLNLGVDKQTYQINTNSQIFLPIIQGKWEKRTYTGTGELNQTLQIDIRGTKDIENFNYEVIVDGEMWEIKKHLYDMLPNEKSCVVRTGFNGGIDVIFGNSGFGLVPKIGTIIEVSYLVSDGNKGSIFRRTLNDWTFIDSVIDGNGNGVDLNRIFDVQIYTDINFGADKEDISFTRNILPIVSNNFVVGLPQQYAYQIKKLGVFSHVNAYESDNSIHIVATPNIKLFKNRNSNYFTINKAAFELDNYEKSKVVKYLKSGGNIMLTKKFQIDSPNLSYYILNVFIITYSDSIDDNVNSQIYDNVSEYFLNLNRIDRIPKVDLIKAISSIPDIHSVDISFVCKKNEDYHREAKIEEENRRNQFASKSELNLVRPNPNYNPNETIGLDPILGDILFKSDELPIIRGGFYDRNNVFYNDGIDGSGLKTVNIVKKGIVDVKNKNNS